ncbi:histidine phosphatase family protein [Sulfurimonas sediminis]|uniref:Histidine phosphatase family protein n=1 Tax=Sulfurimonas sediminis TaxID=2590020 RepID=A0A7M1B1D8_9BACT|nr:histidine phosphatase family protein [Sulfurimonas sediminis]QOP42472.1 histidine phosphatase family protein [Sulfurimonas sediminis]
MKITLVRHGEVEEAYIGKYNGHNDIGLSKKGHEDAKNLAKAFTCKAFDLVYCSDLRRAKETLATFSQAKNAVYTSKLREKSWGRDEGMGFDEIRAQGIEYENFAQWIKALDGEPYEKYMQRVKAFFFKELPVQKGENILVVTHAGVIRTLMAIVQNLSLEDAFAIALPYASYTVYDTKLQTFSTIKT